MLNYDEAWSEAVELAAESAGRSEIWRRAAISRLYYACFHLVGRAVHYDTTRPGNSHERLLEVLNERGGEAPRLRNRLKQLLRSRVTADYYLGRDVERQAVFTAISDARAVHKLLPSLA